MENKLVCELNDHRVSLMSSDELLYGEGFVFSLYSETFQTSGNDMKVGNILFTLTFIFVDELKTKEKPLELKFACYCMKISGSLYAKSMSFYW